MAFPISPRTKYPQAIDSEKGLLSSALLSPDRVLSLCQEAGFLPNWFHDPSHNSIYSHLVEMKELGKPVDLITLTEFMEHKGTLEGVGGAARISDLFTFAPTATNANYYLDIVKEKFLLRSIMLECERIHTEAPSCSSVQEAFNLVTGAFAEAKELAMGGDDEKDYDKKAKMAFLDEMDAVANGKQKPDFLYTFLPTIDAETGGIRKGEMVLIRGLKGCGKSLLGQLLLQDNVVKYGRKGAVYTFEMPYNQYMRRLVAAQETISLKSMRDGRYKKGEFQRFLTAWNQINDSSLSIYDIPRIKRATPENIFGSIRRHKRTHGLDVCMIDHLHLVRFPKGKNAPRADEAMHEFSAEFKALCLELDMVGILLAQENNDGGTFGGSQVETDVDNSLCLIPIRKQFGKVTRVIGTSGIFIDKWREGNLLGTVIPVRMLGEFAKIQEGEPEKREVF